MTNTRELLDQLSDAYADRISRDDVEALDELLLAEDWDEGLRFLVTALGERREAITADELAELEHLCEALDVDLDLLEDLEVL